MSLYIRTKMFQILEVTKKEEDTSYKDVSYWYKCKRNRYKMNSMHSDFVIKESENIEDLCDEFIGIYKEQGLEPHFIETSLEGLIEETAKYCYDNTTLDDLNIYGAIWTYEGLKYVAKMNENKELELI